MCGDTGEEEERKQAGAPGGNDEVVIPSSCAHAVRRARMVALWCVAASVQKSSHHCGTGPTHDSIRVLCTCHAVGRLDRCRSISLTRPNKPVGWRGRYC